MRIKKVTAIFLCLFTIVALAACNGNSASGFTGVEHSNRPTDNPTSTPGETPPDIQISMPDYTDGEMTAEKQGDVTGITITNANEGYFKEYIQALKADGWNVEEAANNFYIAGKGNWAVALTYTDNTAAIMICPVSD